MKKMSHLSDLRTEQLHLLQEQKALEGSIRKDWQEIKSGLRPARLKKNLWQGILPRLKSAGLVSLSLLITYRLFKKLLH